MMEMGRFNRIRIDRQNVKIAHNKTMVSLETKDGTAFEVRQIGRTIQISTTPEKKPICILDETSRQQVENWLANVIPATRGSSSMYNLLKQWLYESNYFSGQKLYSIQFTDNKEHSCQEWEELCEDYAPHKCSRMVTVPEYCFAAILGCVEQVSKEMLAVTMNVNEAEIERGEKYCLVNFQKDLNANIFPFKYETKMYWQSIVVLED